MRDLLFPLLKNSESGVDDRGHRLRITHTHRRDSKSEFNCPNSMAESAQYFNADLIISDIVLVLSGFALCNLFAVMVAKAICLIIDAYNFCRLTWIKIPDKNKTNEENVTQHSRIE